MRFKMTRCRAAFLLAMILMLTTVMGNLTLAAEELPQEAAKEPQKQEFMYEDEEILVKAELDEGSMVPDGAKLIVKELHADMADQEDRDQFQRISDAVNTELSKEALLSAGYKYYDFYFQYEESVFHPKDGTMSVAVTYKRENVPAGFEEVSSDKREIQLFQYLPDLDAVKDLRMGENAAAINQTGEGNVTDISYRADSFSAVALVWSLELESEIAEEPGGPPPDEESKHKNPLTQIETMDSTSQGVEIKMYNYSNSTPDKNWGPYNLGGQAGMLKQGLLEPTLNKEGLPVAKDKKIGALKKSFSGGKSANHLFSKNIYDTTGDYYYSSFDNYAYYNQKTGNFTVYDQIGTPSDQDAYFFKRGNFMPYNKIEAGKLSKNKNYYDQYGNVLSQDDPRYAEPLYKTEGADFYFGMTVEAAFVQPRGGVHNGTEMVYEFNGDDDMWVFVDDVLVLDLGGIHDAQTGRINFATGEVTWSDTQKGGKPQMKSTSIRNQFKNAGREESVTWKGDTFSNYSQHEIKVFYMERGAGASNCKIKFNLPVVPKGSVNVGKEVTNINEGSYSDVDFLFKLFVEKENQSDISEDDIKVQGKWYGLQKNQDYLLKEGVSALPGKTGADGTFVLKHGQMAQFTDVADMDKEYIVQEVDVVQDYYDDFEVNGIPFDETGGLIEHTAGGKMIVQTAPLRVGENLQVNMQNYCSSKNHHDLTIHKKMADGQKSKEDFMLQIRIGGRPYTGTYAKLRGQTVIGEGQSSKEGIISLRADESARISDIAAGTSFEVEEVKLNSDRFEYPVYDIAQGTAENIYTEGCAKGIIKYKSNAQITVLNKEKLGALKIIKQIDSAKYENGDPIFTFRISGPDEKVWYRTLRLDETTSGRGEIIVPDLPFGTYTVQELNTIRYWCQSENPQTNKVYSSVQIPEYLFQNKLLYQKNESHTDVLENAFTIEEDGSITCTQNKNPGRSGGD